MRRFYSFMLMATMLFIGLNAQAATLKLGTTEAGGQYQTLAAAVTAASAGDVIELVSPLSPASEDRVWINKNLTLNLKGFTYSTAVTGKVFIGITAGSLTIAGNGGTLKATAVGDDLIRIYGTYQKIDVKQANVTPHAELILEHGATLESNNNAISIDVMRADQPDKFGASFSNINYACDFYKNASSGFGVSNGVKIEISGTIKAYKYGIKCNGTVRDGKEYAGSNLALYFEAGKLPGSGNFTPAAGDKQYSPYIHVTGTAQIKNTDFAYNKAVAVYASGTARWLIEGNCDGSTGVYVKSGDVKIDGATVTSSYTGKHDPVDGKSNKSGVTGAGSAVAVESNENYAGNIQVEIGGGANLQAQNGYALEEKVSNNENNPATAQTKVETVEITGATFQGGQVVNPADPEGETIQGTIVISEKTVTAAKDANQSTHIVVTTATIQGEVTLGNDDNSGDDVATLNQFVSESVVIEPQQAGDPTVVVPLNVNLTSDHFASFSSPIDLFIVAASSSDCKPYVGVVSEDKLVLTQVSYIKAGEGVILYGENATECHFTTGGTADGSYNNNPNDLHPSSDWTVNSGSVYCLRNVTGTTMLYRYTGASMPANKAYLDFGQTSSPAPARIRMVFSDTQDVENIEAGAKAVKFMQNGNIFIKRGEKVYNVQGQIVK